MLWHNLALQLGGCTVAELQRKMSSAEFTRWKAYFKLEPGEPFRTDLRFAVIARLLANIFRGKGDRPATVEDFMVFSNAKRRKAKEKPKTVAEMKSLWASIKAVLGAQK
jgi:hypothetical protein